jgi:hypothetical protein
MKHNYKYSRHTHSYLALRKAVGWIGILLSFALMFGGFLIFGGQFPEKSISFYYYTGMRNVLVGALCAISLFMFFYTGYDKRDDWAGNFAGLFAIGIAWFPTTESGPTDLIGLFHFICAVLFFLTLIVFSVFLFTLRSNHPTPQKLMRNKIYRLCGIIMAACLIAIAIYFIFIESPGSTSCFVFWAEMIALVAFGFSWLTKGETIFPDKNSRMAGE